ncbi:MAG: hypothetical protein ABI254_13645 [Chthoniobacterales bacterium]
MTRPFRWKRSRFLMGFLILVVVFVSYLTYQSAIFRDTAENAFKKYCDTNGLKYSQYIWTRSDTAIGYEWVEFAPPRDVETGTYRVTISWFGGVEITKLPLLVPLPSETSAPSSTPTYSTSSGNSSPDSPSPSSAISTWGYPSPSDSPSPSPNISTLGSPMPSPSASTSLTPTPTIAIPQFR